MSKPETLKDLVKEGHVTLGEVRGLAREIFDGETTAAGPEGYLVTAVNFDLLPDHVQQFVMKAILEFRVENVLDAKHDNDSADQLHMNLDDED